LSDERKRLASLLTGQGIEIGALHRPLELPAQAVVTYVDKVPMEVLREHYKTLEASELAPVQILGSAEDLSAFADASLDFVIANHLIEHLEDPIQALKEFSRVLRRGGLVYMCVPDSRVTFDRTRPLTPFEHVLAEHRGGREVLAANRREHFVDWVSNVSDVGQMEEVARPVPLKQQEAQLRQLMEMEYSIHFHCWTSATFLDFMKAVRQQEGVPIEVLAAIDTTRLGQIELILVAAKSPTPWLRWRALLAGGRAKWPIYAQRPGRAWRRLKDGLRASPAGPALVSAYRRVKRHT
jgi:predicted SAM-dependent methyltransferase